MQTFLPYADLAVSCRVLDDKRLGKQRVEVFQVLRALTWPTYAWKSHPAVRMWRGFVPGLVRYGVESCRAWTDRGYGDNLLPQLLAWSGGEVPHDPELPPWFGVEALHLSHRSNLLRKDPAHYRPLFGDEPDDLPYLWPPDLFPQWPLREGLGVEPWPWQSDAVKHVADGHDVLLVARTGATTAGVLAGQQRHHLTGLPTAVVAPPLGPPAGPVPAFPPPPRVERAAPEPVSIARDPGPADLAAMAAEAEPSSWLFRPSVPERPLGLVVLEQADRLAPQPLMDAPVLALVHRTDDPGALTSRLRDPVHVGGGWDVAAHLVSETGRPRDLVARQPGPVLVRVDDRRAADRLITALRALDRRATSWDAGMRASRAAEAIAAWRTRRLDVLVATDQPPLGRVRPATYVDLLGPDGRRDRVELAAAPRAVWPAEDDVGCLRRALLAPYGEPVDVPCGRCSACEP